VTPVELPAVERLGASADDFGEVVDLGRSPFFDGQAFIPSRLGEWIRSRYRTATGGRQLYAFRDGAYQPSEGFLRSLITDTLGDQWRARRADETISYLQQSSYELWERPPANKIAVANGILSLPGRKLTPSTPEFRSPVRIAAAYDPAAKCPAIERFLGQVFPAGADLLYELAGHLALADSRQRAFLLLGPGGNGKTTVLKLNIAFLGRQNVSSVSLQALEEDRFASADLYGKLANIFGDLDARALRATSVFKSITGGDPIRAERKHRPSFSFVPYARLVFSANEPPPTSDSSRAFFDRWIIIPFEQRIRGTGQERAQDELLAELTTPQELSGLLNHALDGLDRLSRTGQFTQTAETQQAADSFRISADSAAGFLAEHCQIDRNARVRRAALWNAYRAWCEENNRRALGSQRFHARIRDLVDDLDEVEVNGKPTYIGIHLEEQ